MTWQQGLILFIAGVLGGMVNAVAGGGTLLTFPALLLIGYPAVVANATSTVALWPGQLGSLVGYRKELGQDRGIILRLAVPSIVGGILGALLLLHTPPKTFANVVPYLILLATLLFMAQEPISRWLRARAARNATPTAAPTLPLSANATENIALHGWPGVLALQLGIAIYGGYFGAGAGILMLAALGFLGLTNIHRMNALKNINALSINVVAAALFVGSGLVAWPVATLMAAGAIAGGYGGARIARRIGQRNVRLFIIGIGFSLTLYLLLQKVIG